MKLKERLTRNPCKECLWYVKENNLCQSKKCSVQGGSYPFVTKLDKMFCETYKGEEKGMTHKDKQDVIAVCNILADKMSDGGKVAVQQIIEAVKDMVEHEPCEDCIRLNKLDDIITKAIDDSENQTECQTLRWVLDVMSELSSVTPQTKWIPIKTRPMTEEEKEEIGHEYAYMYDCPLPDDAQDVLITDCWGNVEIDTFCRDYEGVYFETNCDDGEVIAWMPLPERYKESEE